MQIVEIKTIIVLIYGLVPRPNGLRPLDNFCMSQALGWPTCRSEGKYLDFE